MNIKLLTQSHCGGGGGGGVEVEEGYIRSGHLFSWVTLHFAHSL